MKKIKKPFNGPYCTVCHYIARLCNKCEAYVNQDHVDQTENYILPNNVLDKKISTKLDDLISSNTVSVTSVKKIKKSLNSKRNK